MEFFLCFSLIKNSKTLFDTTVPAGAITCLNGIRTISIMWVVMGHFVIFTFQQGLGKGNLHTVERTVIISPPCVYFSEHFDTYRTHFKFSTKKFMRHSVNINENYNKKFDNVLLHVV